MICIEAILYRIESILWGFPTIFLLIFTHIYFTIKLKFPQKNVLKGLKYVVFADKKNNSEGLSSFKSTMAVLAGTLGTGNIIGVASAVCIGGIGSIFWIFLSGVFAIATKYAETYIVLKYRKKNKKGYYGGAMYVLKERVGSDKLALMFCIFALIASLGIGCMIQSNAIAEAINESYNINKYIAAILVTVICSYAIFGSEKRISNMSSILVPVATITYITLNIVLLYMFRANILNGVIEITKAAFDFKSVVGGITGISIIQVIRTGLSKGLFSNEAGMGSSPMFDATVREKNIQKQATIASTTVFFDTVILCTLTGIVIAASGMYKYTNNPIVLINEVFSNVAYGSYMLSFTLIIFAIATIPCWAYYSTIAIKYLFKSKKIYEIAYKVIYTTCVYIGGIMALNQVWTISNIANILMIIPNIYMLFYLREEIK